MSESEKGLMMNSIVLVVAAHPDDEILGMGGTIARHVAAGDQVHIMFLGDGVGSRGSSAALIEERQEMARAACEHLGVNVSQLHFQAFPDNAFDSVPLLEVVQAIEILKGQLAPDVVYTHHGGDLNIDHRIACQAVLTAFRPQLGERCKEIYSFEVNSATEWSAPSVSAPFLPDTYVDVSAYRFAVLKAYACYAEEVRPDPHVRSLKAFEVSLERRGREVGVEEAEAFMTLRRIVREGGI